MILIRTVGGFAVMQCDLRNLQHFNYPHWLVKVSF